MGGHAMTALSPYPDGRQAKKGSTCMRWKAEIMGLLKEVEQVAIGGQLRRQDNTTIIGGPDGRSRFTEPITFPKTQVNVTSTGLRDW